MDREREWSLIVEDANTKLHLLLKSCVVDEISKHVVKAQALTLITTTTNALKAKKAPIDLIEKTENALKLRFVEWMNIITANLEKAAKKNPMAYQTYKSITGNELKDTKAVVIKMDGYDEGSIDKVSSFVTTQEHAAGQAYMDDYVAVVKKTMQAIANKNLVMRDKNGRKLSVRNLAEMTARFQDTLDKLQELEDNNIKFVVASSHVNASDRCQIWQGKVFKLDVDPGSRFVQNVDLKYDPTPIGKIDGIDYYSLADAMSHGFLGYNCRHRLVKYTKGMDMFKEYPPNQIDRERNLEAKQRRLERQIRKCKQNASMAVTPEERKKWTEQSKMYQEKYHQFCHSNGMAEIPWRTRISRDERSLNIDYDGDILTYGEYVNSDLVDTPELREKYKTYFQSHKKELLSKVKDGTIRLEECSNPLLYDENHKVRNIYHNDILGLKEELSILDIELESKARYAFGKRNEIRDNARDIMVDMKAKVFLKVVMDRDITFEEMIFQKMGHKKLSYDSALQDIIESSTKTNDFFDEIFSKKRWVK